MSRFTDPYTPCGATYECYDCGSRVVADEHRSVRPDYHGAVRNIAVPRE